MNIAQIATTRRTCKAFDPTRQLPPAVVGELKTVLRYAPASVNSQPWHFLIASSAAGKDRIAGTLDGAYGYNAAKVRHASHVVVLCARTDLDDGYLATLLAQEEADGRFPAPEGKAMQGNARAFYVNLHRQERRDLDAWIDCQVYIALGNLMMAAGALAVDACPMEGIDTAAIDSVLGLRERGLRCVVLCALGYGSAEDFNARLPKSRLPEATIFSEI